MQAKLIMYGLILAGLIGGAFYVKHLIAANTRLEIEVAQAERYREGVEERDRKAAAALARDQAADAATSATIATLRAEAEALRQKAARVRNTIEVPNESACPDRRLSVGFFLCARAAITGDPTDAAACEAAGVDAAEPGVDPTLQPAG